MSVRTDQQNKALHLWFRWVADALNEKHYDFRDLRVEIAATEHLVKELMFKPVMQHTYGKISTTKLEKNEVSVLYDVLNRAFGEKLGINVPFPSEEDVQDAMRKAQEKKKG